MAIATLISLADAQPLRKISIPGDPSIPTRHRWALSGIVAANGQRVRLQTWKVGGRFLTTPQAVETFILALSGDAPAGEADEILLRRSHEASRALEAMGL